MPTNILRKLEIAVERKVVAAQSRTTLPRSAPWRSNCRAGARARERRIRQEWSALNRFMACSRVWRRVCLDGTIHSCGALRVGLHFSLSFLALTIARAKSQCARRSCARRTTPKGTSHAPSHCNDAASSRQRGSRSKYWGRDLWSVPILPCGVHRLVRREQ